MRVIKMSYVTLRYVTRVMLILRAILVAAAILRFQPLMQTVAMPRCRARERYERLMSR